MEILPPADFQAAMKASLSYFQERSKVLSPGSLIFSASIIAVSATEASIQNAHILSLKADSIDLPEIEPISIKTPNGDIDSLNTVTITAQNAAVSSANIDNLEVKNSLIVPEFNASKLTSTALETENAGIKEASIQKLNISGVPIECIDVKYSGWTNGYLHKLNVRANGILIFKLNNASIVVTPGNISSNYDKLYAAYKADDGYVKS